MRAFLFIPAPVVFLVAMPLLGIGFALLVWTGNRLEQNESPSLKAARIAVLIYLIALICAVGFYMAPAI